MKIAVLTSSYPRYPGDGTAPFIMEICEGLARAGHDVLVAAPFDIEIKNNEQNRIDIHRFRYIWPDNLHIMGHGRSLSADVKLRPLSYLLLPFYLLSAFISLYRITRAQNSDIIHAHWVLPNGLAAAWVAAIRRIPLVVSLHGSDVYLANRNTLFKLFARYIFRRASGVTACSPELLEASQVIEFTNKTILLPYGVDPQKFNPQYRSEEFRHQLAATDEELVIITLGRLVFKKGFDILITASSKLLHVRPAIKVVIGGEGPLREDLQKQIDDLNIAEKVQLLGNISWDNVPQFLASGDLFILPSIRDQFGNIDGLPNVLLEAMSSGTPVIASDIPGVRTVIDDNQDGLLFPSGDIEKLFEAINLLIDDKPQREALGKSARKTIERDFTWDAIINSLEAFFELVLEDVEGS